MRSPRLLSFLLLLSVPAALAAVPFPCKPCAGVRLVPPPPAPPTTETPAPAPSAAPTPPPAPATPTDLAPVLQQIGQLKPGSPLWIAWEAPLDGNPAVIVNAIQAVRQAGGTPWVSLVFRTPGPLARAADRLQTELRAAAALAAQAPAGTWFQVVWRPEGSDKAPFSPADYAFLLKRAAVALTGARAQALVASEPLPLDEAALAAFYGEEVAAYLEAVALEPGTAAAQAAALAAVQRLDPGRPVVLDGPALPAEPGEALAGAARAAAAGFDLTLFHAADGVRPIALAPFVVLARELAGDLSYDATSEPTGAVEAWSFVRGKDLALRVIARTPPGARELALHFPDPGLRRPTRFP